MEIGIENRSDVTVITLCGRMDSSGAVQFNQRLEEEPIQGKAVLMDMAEVDYISSAGIGALVREAKMLDDMACLGLINLSDYVREVLRMTGIDSVLHAFPTYGAAMDALQRRLSQNAPKRLGEDRTSAGVFSYTSGSDAAPALHVTGSLADVLHARVTPESLALRAFSPTEVSLGVGGLGGHADDCAPFLGETLTVGGAMLWRPTDGNERPDMLAPEGHSKTIGIRAAHGLAFASHFTEHCHFQAHSENGVTLGALYAQLLERAREAGHPEGGLIGVAMLAEMDEVRAAGLKLSPIRDFAPTGHGRITDPQNVSRWFQADEEARHCDVTALIVGVAAERAEGTDAPENVFFLHPSDAEPTRQLLVSHAAIFEKLPWPDDGSDIDDDMRATVREGVLLDMRRLLNSSRIKQAKIGVAHIAEIHRQGAG